jgi:TPR repeat protein
MALGLLLVGCSGTLDAARGVYSAQLGEYRYNKGDYRNALPRFRRGAEQNNAYACYRLYTMYQYGQGTAKNPPEATRMLEKAAGLGDETSQVILGSRLLFGKVADRPRGAQLLKAAAARENRYAYEYLALAYQYGLGVEANAELALENRRLAISQGSDLGSFIKNSIDSKPKAAEAKAKAVAKADTGSSSVELLSAVQKELKRLGYYRGKIDGQTGPMTRDAIARFQKDHGYPVNETYALAV